MEKSCYGAHTVLPLGESEEDVQEDQQQGKNVSVEGTLAEYHRQWLVQPYLNWSHCVPIPVRQFELLKVNIKQSTIAACQSFSITISAEFTHNTFSSIIFINRH
jgi:hypothetical protein